MLARLAACRGTDLIARRDLAMLSLLLDTGIRRGELATLRLGDLNLGQRLAFIEASTSKSRRGRAVVYGDSTARWPRLCQELSDGANCMNDVGPIHDDPRSSQTRV